MSDDKWTIVLDLPLPPSVNRFRAGLGNQSPVVRRWMKQADMAYVLQLQTHKARPLKLLGLFEVWITWNELRRPDWDNPIKPLMDYLERLNLIENDRLCRRGTVDYSDVPNGCRVRLREWRS